MRLDERDSDTIPQPFPTANLTSIIIFYSSPATATDCYFATTKQARQRPLLNLIYINKNSNKVFPLRAAA